MLGCSSNIYQGVIEMLISLIHHGTIIPCRWSSEPSHNNNYCLEVYTSLLISCLQYGGAHWVSFPIFYAPLLLQIWWYINFTKVHKGATFYEQGAIFGGRMSCYLGFLEDIVCVWRGWFKLGRLPCDILFLSLETWLPKLNDISFAKKIQNKFPVCGFFSMCKHEELRRHKCSHGPCLGWTRYETWECPQLWQTPFMVDSIKLGKTLWN